jgi:apolipoprotein N-acyltransferase
MPSAKDAGSSSPRRSAQSPEALGAPTPFGQNKKMSDIQLNLDGLIAFLVAAALALVLLLVLSIMSLRNLIRARRKGERFTRQPSFPHVLGITVSLAACAAVMLFIWFTDGGAYPRTLNAWLDRWSPLWGALVLALAPACAYLIKGRLRFADAAAPRV